MLVTKQKQKKTEKRKRFTFCSFNSSRRKCFCFNAKNGSAFQFLLWEFFLHIFSLVLRLFLQFVFHSQNFSFLFFGFTYATAISSLRAFAPFIFSFRHDLKMHANASLLFTFRSRWREKSSLNYFYARQKELQYRAFQCSLLARISLHSVLHSVPFVFIMFRFTTAFIRSDPVHLSLDRLCCVAKLMRSMRAECGKNVVNNQH